jgi:hypothetical protein
MIQRSEHKWSRAQSSDGAPLNINFNFFGLGCWRWQLGDLCVFLVSPASAGEAAYCLTCTFNTKSRCRIRLKGFAALDPANGWEPSQ